MIQAGQFTFVYLSRYTARLCAGRRGTFCRAVCAVSPGELIYSPTAGARLWIAHWRRTPCTVTLRGVIWVWRGFAHEQYGAQPPRILSQAWHILVVEYTQITGRQGILTLGKGATKALDLDAMILYIQYEGKLSEHELEVPPQSSAGDCLSDKSLTSHQQHREPASSSTCV